MAASPRASTPIAAAVGLAAGASFQLNALAELLPSELAHVSLPARVAVGAAVGALVLGAASVAFRALLRRLGAPPSRRTDLLHAATYAVFLGEAVGATGLRLPGALLEAVLLGLFAALNAGMALASEERLRLRVMPTVGWLSVLFFASGVAALIYQVTWQRTMYAAFGINIESVTLIVTLFMAGLGLGSFAGGRLCRRYPGQHVRLFFGCEVLIGLFGLVSLPLIRGVGSLAAHQPLPVTALALAALLLPPTTLMGATLPILVEYVTGRMRHVGAAVGLLYFVNTLGSAAACFLTAGVLFPVVGQQAAVAFAAAANFSVAALVWSFARTVEARPVPTPSPVATGAQP